LPTNFDVTLSGAAKDNSLRNLASDFMTTVPHDPFRPTSRMLGAEMAEEAAGSKTGTELDSNKRAAKAIADAAWGPLDMQPSQAALGEGKLRANLAARPFHATTGPIPSQGKERVKFLNVHNYECKLSPSRFGGKGSP
jgi:hypothetical protein